jgi:uncharacterized membrane protein YeiH
MAQAVGCRFLSAEIRVRSQVSTCWICGGLSGTGGRFLSEVFPVSIIPAMFHPLIYLHVALIGLTKYRCVGAFQKAVLFRKWGSNAKQNTFT